MNIIAWLWILTGALWVIWPAILRGWFTRKTGRRAFWLVWGCLALMILHVGSLAWGIQVRALKTVALAGVLLLLGLMWTVQSSARTQLRLWCQNIPLKVFRVAGLLNIAVGTWLLYAKHR